jgi:hypothetical protein
MYNNISISLLERIVNGKSASPSHSETRRSEIIQEFARFITDVPGEPLTLREALLAFMYSGVFHIPRYWSNAGYEQFRILTSSARFPIAVMRLGDEYARVAGRVVRYPGLQASVYLLYDLRDRVSFRWPFQIVEKWHVDLGVDPGIESHIPPEWGLGKTCSVSWRLPHHDAWDFAHYLGAEIIHEVDRQNLVRRWIES